MLRGLNLEQSYRLHLCVNDEFKSVVQRLHE
jgi:hypothetical protein